jgi:hypothetical protein
LVTTSRIEVLATALDGSGVENEVYMLRESEKQALADKGYTQSRLEEGVNPNSYRPAGIM